MRHSIAASILTPRDEDGDAIASARQRRLELYRGLAKACALMVLCDRLEAALTTADATRARLLNALLHEALAKTDERQAAA